MVFGKDISWWYWAATAASLAGGVSGWVVGFDLAIALSSVQVVHFIIRNGRLTAFPVQVRVAYLGLLLLAQWPPFYFLYGVQLIGTTAMVVFSYCLLARILSLLPWNRSERLSWAVVGRTFWSPPVKGNILQGLPASGTAAIPHPGGHAPVRGRRPRSR